MNRLSHATKRAIAAKLGIMYQAAYRVTIFHYHHVTVLNPRPPYRIEYTCYHAYTCQRGRFIGQQRHTTSQQP